MRPNYLHIAVAIALALVLTSCEESVSPILESDRQFTLFGTLDMASDTQFVRVIPIRPTLAPSAETPDVTFTSTELSSGRTEIWSDSLITFSDGSPGFLYYSPFRVRAGRSYLLEIQPNGSPLVTSAETTVPAQPVVTVLPEVIQSIISATESRLIVRQSVEWEGVLDEPFAAEVWYRFFRISDFTFRDIRIPYAPILRPMEPDGWHFDLDLKRDRDSLGAQIDLTPFIFLAGLGMTITVLDEDFVQPGGIFDPEVLAQPGTRSNVTNGFGFVGSVGRFSVEWLLADSTINTLGYNLMEPRRPHGRDWVPSWPAVPGSHSAGRPRSRPN